MKNIKKFLFVAVMAVMGMTSCQKDSEYAEPTGRREAVKIAVSAADLVSTKAIGDGTKVTEVYYTAFVDGKPVRSLQNKLALVNGKAELNLNLVKNVEYKFAFWAQPVQQDGAASPFDVSKFYSDATVALNYDGLANDDNRDAFCAAKTILVTESLSENVYLRRPFAQINFCASDYEMVKEMGLHTDMKSEVRVYGLPDVLNVLDGTVSSSQGSSVSVDALFALSAKPSGEDEYITVQGNQYGYISMNYVLASDIGETVSVSAKIQSGNSLWETTRLDNVPVARNHKTHILGTLFTVNAKLEIIVVPDFETPDYIVK